MKYLRCPTGYEISLKKHSVGSGEGDEDGDGDILRDYFTVHFIDILVVLFGECLFKYRKVKENVH